MVSSFPSSQELGSWKDESAERDMEITLGLIQASRALRQSHQVPMSKVLPFTIWTNDSSLLGPEGALQQSRGYLSHFTRAHGEITFIDGSLPEDGQQGMSAIETGSIVHVVSPQVKLFTSQSAIQKAIASAEPKDAATAATSSHGGTADRAKQQQELQRLDRKLNGVRADLERLNARVSQPKYLERVPDHVQAIDVKRKQELLAQEEHLLTTIHTLRGALT